jgi:hypothetical protein
MPSSDTRGDNKFQCFPSWRFKKYLYQGIINIRASGSYQGHVDKWIAKCFPDGCCPRTGAVAIYRLKGRV